MVVGETVVSAHGYGAEALRRRRVMAVQVVDDRGSVSVRQQTNFSVRARAEGLGPAISMRAYHFGRDVATSATLASLQKVVPSVQIDCLSVSLHHIVLDPLM